MLASSHGRQHVSRVLRAALCAVLAVAFPCGCTEDKPPPPDHTYTVRGVIVRVPNDVQTSRELMIKHERIEDFTNAKGEKVGMPAMTMPFNAGQQIDLSKLKIGDQVDFSWDVRWKAKPHDEITKLTVVPPQATGAAAGAPNP